MDSELEPVPLHCAHSLAHLFIRLRVICEVEGTRRRLRTIGSISAYQD